MNHEEKVYIGKTHRFVVEQTIGFSKLLGYLREKFEVMELRNNEEEIILVEEKKDT
jgi:hypothetical protein